MAWLEKCRIDAHKHVEHLKNRGISVQLAIKILSRESDIPESTLNNWIYERKRANPVDIFDYFLDEMWKDLQEKDFKKWVKSLDSVKFRTLNLYLWLWLDTEHIFNWYRAAFNYYGKSARITDGWRAGVIRCYCKTCNGKVHNFDQLHNKAGEDFNYSPKLMRMITKRGYVKFNVL